MSDFTAAIKLAHAKCDATGQSQCVYTREFKIAAISLSAYKHLNLDARGAKRICIVSRCQALSFCRGR